MAASTASSKQEQIMSDSHESEKMDVDENSVSSDSSGDSDSAENDEKEEGARRDIETLEQKVLENENPRESLGFLLKIVDGYRSLGEIVKCREIREKTVSLFGVGPNFWMQWIEDESRIATTVEEKLFLRELYERAVKEYSTVDIWLSYVQFCVGFVGEQEGFEAVRNVFEGALAAVGLHVVKGDFIWDAYREFEEAILSVLEGTRTAGAEAQEKYEAQMKRLDSIFRRQLAVPHEHMKKTYKEYLDWIGRISGENAEVDETVQTSYRYALEKLLSIRQYEVNIQEASESEQDCSDKEKPFERVLKCASLYFEYLDNEDEPERKQFLFERAVADTFQCSGTWLKYIVYLDENVKDGSMILPVCERSVRNCFTDARLWMQYMRKIEKYDESSDSVKGVVEQALTYFLEHPNDNRKLWMAYLDCLRRQVNWGGPEQESQISDLRTVYDRACEHLAELFGLDGDPNCELLRSWARMEGFRAKNTEAMRHLWNDILSQGHKSKADMWMEYIHLEKCYGDTKHLRRLFPRALAATTDNAEKIAEAWLAFERDEGSLESYERCEKAVELRVKELERERRRQQSALNRRNLSGSKLAARKDKKKTTERDVGGGAGDVLKVKNVGESSVKVLPNPVERQCEHQKKESSGKHGSSVQHDPTKDDRTVFVSNLDYSTSEDAIKEKFTSVGTITDFRLVKDFKGRSKGYCYVEFSTSSEVEAALKKDREPLGNRPMFVSRCDPDKKSRQPVFKYSCNLEKNKLFVKGLPLTSTKEDLEEIFGAFGDLKDVRIVTYRNGHSKGLAYVEYQDEAAAAHALMKTDGMKIKDRSISVAISKPPERKVSSAFSLTASVKSLGGGAKEKGIRGRGRTQMFVPRVLQNSAAPAASVVTCPSKPPETTRVSAASKTNADFRQMLLGNK